jgi:hypothetical protein
LRVETSQYLAEKRKKQWIQALPIKACASPRLAISLIAMQREPTQQEMNEPMKERVMKNE